MKNPTRCVRAIAIAALLEACAARAAWAAPRIEISVAQLKQVVEMKEGVQTTRLVPATEARPGDVMQYVLTYANKGDAPARNAVVDDRIPKGTTYLADTAAGEGAEITFSSDGGKTYAPPLKLTYEVKLPGGGVERRVTSPSDYTHIRWTVPNVAPGATGTVSFKVKVN